MKSMDPMKEVKEELRNIEMLLAKLKEETKDELEKTKENFEDYFILRKTNGKVRIYVSKLGRSQIVKEKIKQISETLKK
jgi:uncharacterized protein YaaN involved in tellurite resistance